MENNKKNYTLLKDLKVYQLARKLSELGWEIYSSQDWQIKKISGDQFIEAVDSIGANIAEGYGRFQSLDKIKFYYNSRTSLNECKEHWFELLFKRKKIQNEAHAEFKSITDKLSIKLNNFISSTYKFKTDK